MQIVSQIIKQSLVNWKSLKWLQSSKLKDIGEHGITKLKNSLKENNFVQPFNVWEDSKGVIWILDGHHREKALTQLEAEGYEIPDLLPANFVDCIDKKAAAKMVLLYSSIYAKITNEGLGEFLDDFDLDISNLINEIDLPGLDLDSILEPEALPEDIDESPAPLEKTYSILGDVFEIDGKHRLMCGDSTKESDVSILMNGNKADITFTSPPYNADCIGVKNNSSTQKKYLTTDDNQTETEYFNFLVLFINNFLNYSDEVFINIGLVQNNKKTIINILSNYSDKFKDIIYWVKSTAAPHIQNGVVNNLVEFIFAFGDDHRKFSHAQFSQGTYWNVISGNNASSNEYANIHKATFPVYLPKNIIENFSRIDKIVCDPFLGSGSTLIASETTKRICYGMEIDQHYSDVILRRYKKTFPNATFKCLTRNDFPFEELFNA